VSVMLSFYFYYKAAVSSVISEKSMTSTLESAASRIGIPRSSECRLSECHFSKSARSGAPPAENGAGKVGQPAAYGIVVAS